MRSGSVGRGETQVVNLKLNAPEMPVDELEAMLPSGSELSGGTLSTRASDGYESRGPYGL
ncbi:MAG: hypothetical protein WBF42_01390 [Terracidiphilus sp.]